MASEDKKVPNIVNSGTGKVQSGKGGNQQPPTTASKIINMSVDTVIREQYSKSNDAGSTKTDGQGKAEKG